MRSVKFNRMRKLTAASLVFGVVSSQAFFGLVQAENAPDNVTAAAASEARSFTIGQTAIETTGGVRASALVSPTNVAHNGEEAVVFELFSGTTPLGITALQKDIVAPERITAHFNMTGSDLSVRVFVVDSYNGNLTSIGNNLADVVTISPSDTVKVQLLGINDFHGQLDTTGNVTGIGSVGSAVYLATHLKERRKMNPNTLLVHDGDSVGASAPVSAMERDKPTMEFMNMMKFDVGTLGNHEFDYGLAALRAQINGGKDPVNPAVEHVKADFPYVNANAVDATTGENLFQPYVIKEIGGVKIGFIGVVTMATVQKVSPEALKGVKLVEQAPVVNKAVAELKAKGIKAIVVLAHDPATVTKDTSVASGEAVDLANAVDDEVDVIFAGDNHVKVNTVVDNKLIVQAYSYGTAYADVDLEIDRSTGDIVKKPGEIVDVKQAGFTPDPEVAGLVNKYLDKFPVLRNPVGVTDSVYEKQDAYIMEKPLGNLIADAMRDGMKTDFAFMNPGGIRADLPKGTIVYGDLAKIQPFGNTLVKMTLTGAQIKTLLRQQWGAKPADTKTLQISGLKYTADFSKPIAERVGALTKEDGTPITDTGEYTVTVNNFMAAGGDNYKVLIEGKNRQEGLLDIDAFFTYMTKTFNGGKITASIKGRITNINQ